MRTLIKNGTVVTASDTNKTDVLIEGEKVVAMGSGLEAKADQVIDAENRYVMPGAIDVHTHMELPFGGTFASDDFATGTAAAAWGGYPAARGVIAVLAGLCAGDLLRRLARRRLGGMTGDVFGALVEVCAAVALLALALTA